MASIPDFDTAKTRLNTLKTEPSNEIKLKIYALFKQDDAKKQYIAQVSSLVDAEGSSAPSGGATSEAKSDPGAHVVCQKDGPVYRIRLNRPDKYNALTMQMYADVRDALKAAGDDPSVNVTLLTGTGNYYCSGNDLTSFAIDPSKMEEFAQQGADLLKGFVGAFIDHPKPLVAAINGPAVGISVTVLGLCDVVLASDKASFHVPFPQTGQSAEGCSTYVFPRIMGMTKASEFLLGRKLTAQEACDRGLVAGVFPDSQFKDEVEKRLQEYGGFPPQAVRLTKQMSRDTMRKDLHQTNAVECETLRKVWLSEEFMNQIMKFFSRSKSKM